MSLLSRTGRVSLLHKWITKPQVQTSLCETMKDLQLSDVLASTFHQLFNFWTACMHVWHLQSKEAILKKNGEIFMWELKLPWRDFNWLKMQKQTVWNPLLWHLFDDFLTGALIYGSSCVHDRNKEEVIRSKLGHKPWSSGMLFTPQILELSSAVWIKHLSVLELCVHL